MKELSKYRLYVLVSLLIIGGVFFSGYYLGKNRRSEQDKVSTVINKTDPSVSVDFSPFWKAWNIINEKYVPTNGTTTEKVSDQTRVYGAISGMVDSLGD